MMKRTAITVILFLVLMVIGASTGQAGSVDKARDFMKAGMNKQAEAVLEQEINENPANAEAHFLLGKCYLSLDEFRSFPKAEKRFSSAVKLDSSEYAHKIADVYIDAGMQQLERTEKREALEFFDEARKYNSRIGDEIARKCFNKGEELLRYGEHVKADGYFLAAAKYDSSLKSDIARIYYRQYQAEEKLPLLKQASRYDGGEYGKEYAKTLLEKSMDVSADKWENRIKEAEKYLSEREILQFNVKCYSRQLGDVEKLELSPEQWKEGPKIYEGTKIHYLSNKDHWVKGRQKPDSKKTKSKKHINEKKWFKFNKVPSEGAILEFKAIRPETVVYYWVEH